MAEKEARNVTLTIQASVHTDALFLREQIATAKGDGFEVEVASNADGSLLATVIRPGKPRITYAIGAKSFVEAVLKVEEG